MRRIVQACLGVCISWLASCSSSDGANGSGSTGGSAGAGGSTQGGCSTMECFAPFKCVRECGGAVTNNGCCGCDAPLMDIKYCAQDATSVDRGSGQGDASEESTGGRGDARACEQVQCLRAYQCVRQCGGAVVYAGCCACEAPLFDRIQCDGGQ